MSDGDATKETRNIVPGSENTRDFRDALGRFATGVTIVTTDSNIGPLGITANSFASISLDPPLILWAPAKQSRRYQAFADAQHFAIHVIGAGRQNLCHAFARGGTAFEGLEWTKNADNVPLIEDCLARFECETTTVHDGGDHGIVVARVTRATWRAGDPLVFSQGKFGAFSEGV